MKKFLTVLLVIAVMFTFSFSSAFAADPTTTLADKTAAMAKITDKYNDELAKLDSQLAIVKAGPKNPADATAADWATACQEAYDSVKAKLDVQLAEAYQAFGVAEQTAAAYEYGIQGYDFASPTPAKNDGYVYFAGALAKLDLTKVGDLDVWNGTAFVQNKITATSASYKALLAKTRDQIKNYNLEQFAKDDKVTFEGKTKSSYEWAVIAQSESLAYLGTFSEDGTDTTKPHTTAQIKQVYDLHNVGTVGQSETGTFVEGKAGSHPAFALLKTAQTLATDKAKIDYAKAKAMAAIKAAVEAQRSTDLNVQNNIIFKQSVSTKPNQTVIDKANKEIEKINKKYDALLEVLTYRFDNATFTVEQSANYVRAYYNDMPYNAINANNSCLGTFNAANDYTWIAPLADTMTYEGGVERILKAEDALKIVEKIADLKDQAEKIKATIYVDGASALAVDEALKDAIDETYMTGNGSISVVMSDTAVHVNAHKLLGTACANNSVVAKSTVTLEGKDYPTVANWKTTGYSANNKAAVKAIIKDAKEAIKAAKTIDDANKAFLDAYAKYDAVLTTADQAALFNYNGALYKKDEAAKAELKAYIEYKVALMGDKVPGATKEATATAIETYFGVIAGNATENFLAEVVDDASLQAAVADVKAKVDALKTKDELKAEATELAKEASAVKRPVALDQKDAVLALYDKVLAHEDYCTMTGYGYTLTASKMLLATDIQSLEALELKALNDTKNTLGDVKKLTLANEEAVNAYVAAQDAYNDLYGAEGKYKDALGKQTVKDYEDATAYENKIFDLKVEAVEALIKALPLNATNAQVAAAKKAVDDLGFAGLCAIHPTWLTKLSKFKIDTENAVESLKLTAKSSAKKGSITVKWTVKGDASAADGYQVWKSTKQSKGYKKAITTTKKSYKNTKGLKKGTRYYYKVRAYKVVDGKNVYSDWSNKAYRVAK